MHFRHAKTCDLGAFLGESHVTFPHGAQGITCETWYVLSICDHQKMKWLCISLREWVIAPHCQWGIRGELRCEWIIYSSFGILSRKKWHFSLTSTHFFTVTVLQYSKASRSNERLFTSFLTCSLTLLLSHEPILFCFINPITAFLAWSHRKSLLF